RWSCRFLPTMAFGKFRQGLFVAMTLAPASRFARLAESQASASFRSTPGKREVDQTPRQAPNEAALALPKIRNLSRSVMKSQGCASHTMPRRFAEMLPNSRTDHGGSYAIRGIVRSHHYSTGRTESRGRGGL